MQSVVEKGPSEALVAHAGARLAALLGGLLGALLQLLDVILEAAGALAASGAVGLDGLLAVRGQLRIPVALALLLLGQAVVLVLVHLVRVRVILSRLVSVCSGREAPGRRTR